MQEPQVTHYSNGMTGLSHLMRYCIEYEVWAAKGPIDLATLARTTATKYGSKYQKSNLVTRLTEMIDRGRVHRAGRGLYVHSDHVMKPAPVDIFS